MTREASDFRFGIGLTIPAFLLRCGWVAMLLAAPIGASRADDATPGRADKAVARALAYLARQQQPDGSFTASDEQGPRVAPAAGALLAFLSAGRTPAAGRYALATRNAIDFIVRQLPEDGDFGRADGSGPRGQAVISIALAEARGIETDVSLKRPVREALERSSRYIQSAQAPAGGWPSDTGSGADLPATLWMTLSLTAIRDAGLDVPRESFDRAASFARKCRRKNPDGFADHGAPTTANNAAGIAVLILAAPRGAPDSEGFAKLLTAGKPRADAEDFYDAAYTVALAGLLSGAATPPEWQAVLIGKQTDDGNWLPTRPTPNVPGTIAATSQAVLTLTVPDRVLPMYGR